jgi:triosephosphate isomerase
VRPFIGGNWKMHGTLALARARAGGLAARAAAWAQGVESVLFVPALHVPAVVEALRGSGVGVGAQDVHADAEGAFTGSISAPMLVDAGCGYCIVGHSERRHGAFESDAAVARKARAALAAALTPVACVGERLEERDGGLAMAVVRRQLDALLAGVDGDAVARAVVAYEPVWAIGTGRSASLPQVAEMVGAIRQHLVARGAGGVRVIYGGSVNAGNAAALLGVEGVDGALVGGASLDVDAFAAICSAAAPRH